MGFYSQLDMHQVGATYFFINFLKRLRIIGHLEAYTEAVIPSSDRILTLGNEPLPNELFEASYSIIKESYSYERESILQQELLEELFGKIRTGQFRATY